MSLQNAADSKFAKASASFLVPLLLTVVLGLLAFFGEQFLETQQEHGVLINVIDKRTDLMRQRQDEFILGQINANRSRIDTLDGTVEEHETRLERLERVVPLP